MNNAVFTSDGVDAVVTWVSMADPGYRSRYEAYLSSLDNKPAVANSGRYTETGEFAYCIASLLKNAPWINRVHIITDKQSPSFMPQLAESEWASKVCIVDHEVLFAGYEKYLPTFNIRSIKSMFWNIPDLNERFVFLNDDFLLLRPLSISDFFQGDSLVLSGQWLPSFSGLFKKRENSGSARPKNRAAQALSARMAGYQARYFKVPHLPHPMLKSMLRGYFEAHPDQLEQNISYAFRSEQQFLADSLVTHLALKQGRAVRTQGLKTMRFKPEDYQEPRLTQFLHTIAERENIKFACLQSLELANEGMRQRLFAWLDEWVGKPSDIFANALPLPEVKS